MQHTKPNQGPEIENKFKELAGRVKGLSVEAASLLLDLPTDDPRQVVLAELRLQTANISRTMRGIS